MSHQLDYAVEAEPRLILAVARIAFGAGLIAAFLPWLGPMIGVFDWVPLRFEKAAVALAWLPSLVSVGASLPIVLIGQYRRRKRLRSLAILGLILSLTGYIGASVLVTTNWPYHL